MTAWVRYGAVIWFGLLAGLAAAGADELSPKLQAFRDIYKELVEINTTDSAGDTVRAAEAMAARLKAGGIPADDVTVLSSGPRKGNLVARLRGTGAKKPILLIAHIDVVEAKREDWAFDPFVLQEVDGYFRGRGTADNKAMAASFVANLIEYAKEGFRPDRDIILALTADEELSDSPHDGARWLLENHRALIEAEFAINEGGGGTLRDGKPVRNSLQLAEKIYQTYRLEVTDPGGHSASGRRDNAIYQLARALVKLGTFDFPVRLNAVTRSYFERVLPTEQGEVAQAIRQLLAGNMHEKALSPLAERPPFNAEIRTTCVATLLEAGHAENALPQTAKATVNCRVLPDQSVDEVGVTLARVIADPKVKIVPIGKPVLSPPSQLNPDVMAAV
jgi:acetylornithine deacetylase/succinyl-diaminopimelate desuccinylase-like protein